jgi:hypothetical protein
MKIIKGVIENPLDDRTGEKICDFMIGRFVNVLELKKAGVIINGKKIN